MTRSIPYPARRPTAPESDPAEDTITVLLEGPPARIRLRAVPDARGRPGHLDVLVEILDDTAGRRAEAYINVYFAALSSPGQPWTPREPHSHPALYSLPTPFRHAFAGVACGAPYLGVLVSLCDPSHREIEWSCRVFRRSDGEEVLDCRRRRR